MNLFKIKNKNDRTNFGAIALSYLCPSPPLCYWWLIIKKRRLTLTVALPNPNPKGGMKVQQCHFYMIQKWGYNAPFLKASWIFKQRSPVSDNMPSFWHAKIALINSICVCLWIPFHFLWKGSKSSTLVLEIIEFWHCVK